MGVSFCLSSLALPLSCHPQGPPTPHLPSCANFSFPCPAFTCLLPSIHSQQPLQFAILLSSACHQFSYSSSLSSGCHKSTFNPHLQPAIHRLQSASSSSACHLQAASIRHHVAPIFNLPRPPSAGRHPFFLVHLPDLLSMFLFQSL